MKVLQNLLVRFTLLAALAGMAFAFDSDEMEVFDAVEEINQNFYTLLDIPRNAEHSTIKKAFRRLSLVLHPDKSDAPDAEVQFRQLVAVYDILKDANKRKCYDNVLENGLPDWKQAVYYYRRVRKMGLTEMTLILFIIISIGQYLVGWASYLERKYTVEEYLSSRTKRLQKKQKKGKVEMVVQLQQEFECDLKKPSVVDTLPFQVPRLMWFLLVSAPPLTYQWLRDYWDERQRQKLMEAEEQEESDEEEAVVQTRGPRRRKPGFSLPEVKGDPNESANNGRMKKAAAQKASNGPPVISGGLWTDDDLTELVKLVKKFPVGTSERWEKIGEAMRRPAAEVAHMAHKVKDNMVKSLGQRGGGGGGAAEDGEDNGEEAPTIVEEPKKVKTRGGKLGDGAEAAAAAANWSQVQQKALETALAKFPKGATADRWEKIAKCVPGKTKEDCMIRYKQLVGLVKKRKETDPVCEETTVPEQPTIHEQVS